MFSLNVSTCEAQGSSSLCGHVLDVCFPIKGMTDFQSQILSMIYCPKNLSMQNILVPNWGTGPGNMQNLAIPFPNLFPKFLVCGGPAGGWQSVLPFMVKESGSFRPWVVSAGSFQPGWFRPIFGVGRFGRPK